MDPHWFRSARSGSRRAKKDHQDRKKKEFHVLKCWEFSIEDRRHGLINYKETKPNVVFTFVYSVSHVGIFDPALWTTRIALTFSLVHLKPPPLFPKSTYSKYTQCVARMGWVGGGGVLKCVGAWRQYILCRKLTLCFWPDFEPTKLIYHDLPPQTKGGGLRQKNTCRKVPLQVNLFK